ncbi:MAG: hypothetical protein VCB99_10995 [Myxococcota bacterium]
MAIIHEAVRGSAKSMAKLSGVPDYDFLLVDYPWIPTAIWDEGEIQRLAKEVAPQVLAKLTR